MVSLETARLIVRNIQPTDGMGLFEIVHAYASSPFGKFDHKWPETCEEIEEVARRFAQGDDFLAVCLKGSEEFIGFIHFNQIDAADGPVYGLGFIFHPDHQGLGYATEACRAVLEFGFFRLGVKCLVTGTAQANQASMRLLEKLGFHVTQRMRSSMQQDAQGKAIEFDGCELQMNREEFYRTSKQTS